MFLTRILMFCFLVTSSLYVKAQQGYYVAGRVLDAVTMQPLQGASVFAENTTLGTAADAAGNFKLYVPNGGYDLVVTYTGYSTASKRISNSESNNGEIQFLMTAKQKELDDVVVVATNEVKDGFAVYGQFFLEQFIGNSQNSKRCFITNPEVLKFYFSKKKNRLKVIAEEPLKIENKALGYNLIYALDSFTHEYATEVSVYTGNPVFSEMGVGDSLQLAVEWLNARKAVYKGSMLHFMRSVHQQNLTGQGFELKLMVNLNNEESVFALKDLYSGLRYTKEDSTQVVDIKPNVPKLGVIYKQAKPQHTYSAAFPKEPTGFQFSTLLFAKDEFLSIEQNGYFYEQADLTISGYWGWIKVADLLPNDFYLQ